MCTANCSNLTLANGELENHSRFRANEKQDCHFGSFLQGCCNQLWVSPDSQPLQEMVGHFGNFAWKRPKASSNF